MDESARGRQTCADTHDVSTDIAPAYPVANSPLVQYVIPFVRVERKWFRCVAGKGRNFERAPGPATILGAVMNCSIRQCECLRKQCDNEIHGRLPRDITYISVIGRMWYDHGDCAAQNIFWFAPGLALVLRHIKIANGYIVVDDTLW